MLTSSPFQELLQRPSHEQVPTSNPLQERSRKNNHKSPHRFPNTDPYQALQESPRKHLTFRLPIHRKKRRNFQLVIRRRNTHMIHPKRLSPIPTSDPSREPWHESSLNRQNPTSDPLKESSHEPSQELLQITTSYPSKELSQEPSQRSHILTYVLSQEPRRSHHHILCKSILGAMPKAWQIPYSDPITGTLSLSASPTD